MNVRNLMDYYRDWPWVNVLQHTCFFDGFLISLRCGGSTYNYRFRRRRDVRSRIYSTSTIFGDVSRKGSSIGS